MRGIAQVHPVPRDLVAHVAGRARDPAQQLAHESARGKRVERTDSADVEACDDVVVAMRVQLDLRLELLDAPDPPSVGVAHRSSDQIAERDRARAHLWSPSAPGILQMTCSRSHRSRWPASSVLPSTSTWMLSAMRRTASNG